SDDAIGAAQSRDFSRECRAYVCTDSVDVAAKSNLLVQSPESASLRAMKQNPFWRHRYCAIFRDFGSLVSASSFLLR
ncbi:MAG: hypothetical protein OEV41_09810, partial [Gammaproteobacteria bacterium]|nr:hypothetical protein [Gammaproteobacteria bacterium]